MRGHAYLTHTSTPDDFGNVASDKWVYTYTVEYQDFTMPANSGSTVACFADITLPSRLR
jgi:hypothetical protein